MRIYENYGVEPVNFLKTFPPDKQLDYTRDLARAYTGKAPAIKSVGIAYGDNIAEAWLMAQLNDLAEYAGAKEKISERKLLETARMIIDEYPEFTVTQLMHFFQNCKRGNYGRFYGSVDPMTINGWLREYKKERFDRLGHFAEARKKAEHERYMLSRPPTMSFGEYMAGKSPEEIDKMDPVARQLIEKLTTDKDNGKQIDGSNKTPKGEAPAE